MEKQVIDEETLVKERPILFSAPMVRAIRERRKTQTRRVFSDKLVLSQEPDRYKFHYYGECDGITGQGACFEDLQDKNIPWIQPIACPFGEPGDRLWVREAVRAEEVNCVDGVYYLADKSFIEQANTQQAADAWVLLYNYGKRRGATVPPIHAPRWTSRLLLEITAVRVERLQDISEADAKAEGAQQGILLPYGIGDWQLELNAHATYKEGFQYVWYTINTAASWLFNPWVWVVEFKVVEDKTPQPEPEPAPEPAPAVDPLEGLTLTPELQALLAKHPTQRALVAEAYQVGMGELREVVGALGKPRLPLPQGTIPAQCINDLAGPLVRFLNVAVAAKHLKHWLPFGLQPQYFEKDELRGLRFLEAHLDTFLRNAEAVLLTRRIFKSDEDRTGRQGLDNYLLGLADLLSEMLGDLNSLPDPREGHTALRLYAEQNLIQASPPEAWDDQVGADLQPTEVAEEALADA